MRTAIDLTNQQFGKWKVLSRSDKHTSNGAVYWTCQCECGNKQDIAGIDLRAGKTTQCRFCAGTAPKNINKSIKKLGHRASKHPEEEIGKKYGKLTVIDFAYQTLGGSMWKCKCECGNEINVRIDNLHSGKTQSCGCIKSRGEAIIHALLQDNHINYISEYSFDDLVGLNSGKLRFDFAIFNTDNQLIKLIEFQGRQHYENTVLWSNDNKTHDEYKRKYCKEHNIELIEIKYSDINKISLQYLGLTN